MSPVTMLGTTLGQLGKDLAVGQISDAVISTCKCLSTQSSSTWVATLAGLAAGPQFWIVVLGGTALREWRKDQKNEAQVKARFAALTTELEALRAAAARNEDVNDHLTRVLDREDFVVARLPGYEKAELAKVLGREVARVLAEVGLATSGVEKYWDSLNRIEGVVVETRLIAVTTRDAVDAIADRQGEQATKADVEELKRLLLERRPEGTRADPVTERDLTRGIERLVLDADRGGVTAERIVEQGCAASVVDYLKASRAKLVAAKAALDDRVKEDLIERDREIAAAAYLTGRIPEAEAALHRILEAVPNDLGAWARVGDIHLLRGDLDAAIECFSRLIDDARDESDRAAGYGNLGNVYRIRGDLDRAEEVLTKALAVFEALNDQEGMANVYDNFGLIYRRRDDLGRAEEMHKKSLSIKIDLGLKESMAGDYAHLGLVYKARNDLDSAAEVYAKALAIYETLDRKPGMATLYGNLGNVYRSRGDFDLAEKMHKKSLAIEEGLGRKVGMASDYGNLGLVYKARGDVPRAREAFEQALRLFKEIGAKPQIEQVLNLLAELGGEGKN